MTATSEAFSILVVDDRPKKSVKWQELLAVGGILVTAVDSAREALSAVDNSFFDLVLVAEDLDRGRGDEVLVRLVDLFPDLVVTVFSPRASVEGAVKAMRLGAFNYVPEPDQQSDIRAAVEDAMAFRRLRRERAQRRQELARKYDVKNLVGESPPMQEVFRLIHKVASTDATVLILGESGTGKELVARAIHHHSSRTENPLVPVNCGAIPEDLLESELFGHEKGAFTGAVKMRQGRFELASGGTIFLDEIGDMSPRLQVKLLRVLQEHQFERVGGAKTITADLRVLAATHQDLAAKVKNGSFREDLFYRLNVVPIRVPPLRERRSDIPLLANYFVERFSQQKGLEWKELHPEVMERMLRYDWPGNVRELENLLERLLILAEGPTILPEDLPARLAGLPNYARPRPEIPSSLEGLPMPPEGVDFNQAVDAFETSLIRQALERTDWVKNRAAALLKLNRTTLVEKIKKKGISPEGQA
ncbi:MAG: sigma-54 dependent transcriptional regulator [Deltaproteobacteria bacterium]|nr:sigma-54 dependent transcriptional regulator [Deltaproteobacteria bacterium]